MKASLNKHVYCVILTLTSMPRLSEESQLRAVDMLEAGMQQQDVANHFGVHHNTISGLYSCYRLNGSTPDNPIPGRP